MFDILSLVDTFFSLVTVNTERPQTDSNSRTQQTQSQYGLIEFTYKFSSASSFTRSLKSKLQKFTPGRDKNPVSMFPRTAYHEIVDGRFLEILVYSVKTGSMRD